MKKRNESYTVKDDINSKVKAAVRLKNLPKGFTMIEAELINSEAFMSLPGFAPQLLILLLLQRRMEKKSKHNKRPKYHNLEDIRMPYTRLQNDFGINIPRIKRAFEQLLEKGFIEIRHQGGAYKRDQSVYALVDSWRLWRKGSKPFNKHPKDVKRGFQGKGLGAAKKKKDNVIEMPKNRIRKQRKRL